MSIVVQINGVNQTIPTQGDQDWANYTTTTLIALAQAVFPKAGGTFILTGNINFGPNFGLIAKFFSSSSTNTASGGTIKLANTDTVNWRNAANSGDDVLSVNTSDQLVFNGTLLPQVANPSATYGVNLTGANGTAATSLRTDVVLKLDPSISPTWTGEHTFNEATVMEDNLTVNATVTCNILDTSSDITLKKNVSKIYKPLDKLQELNGVTFQWISDNIESVGLIAQDVEKVFPELVSNTTGTKHLNYNGIIGLLVEAVKTLHDEVELLKCGLRNGD